MTEERIEAVWWNETNPAQRAIDALERTGSVRINLPNDFHHALYSHVCPGSEARHEYVDTSGGVDLLEKVTEIRLLKDLIPLTTYLAGVGGRVRVQSPAPRIYIERTG